MERSRLIRFLAVLACFCPGAAIAASATESPRVVLASDFVIPPLPSERFIIPGMSAQPLPDAGSVKPIGTVEKSASKKPTARTLSARKKSSSGSGTDIIDIQHSVLKMPLGKGVDVEDAVLAMESRATELNLKLVGQQKIHEELRARDIDSPHIEILQFCDPEDAKKMVELDPLYAVYMPCRIALAEDSKGKFWLLMMNLDLLVNQDSLPPELQEIAIRVNQNMLSVLTAGVTGDF